MRLEGGGNGPAAVHVSLPASCRPHMAPQHDEFRRSPAGPDGDRAVSPHGYGLRDSGHSNLSLVSYLLYAAISNFPRSFLGSSSVGRRFRMGVSDGPA